MNASPRPRSAVAFCTQETRRVLLISPRPAQVVCRCCPRSVLSPFGYLRLFQINTRHEVLCPAFLWSPCQRKEPDSVSGLPAPMLTPRGKQFAGRGQTDAEVEAPWARVGEPQFSACPSQDMPPALLRLCLPPLGAFKALNVPFILRSPEQPATFKGRLPQRCW